MILIAR